MLPNSHSSKQREEDQVVKILSYIKNYKFMRTPLTRMSEGSLLALSAVLGLTAAFLLEEDIHNLVYHAPETLELNPEPEITRRKYQERISSILDHPVLGVDARPPQTQEEWDDYYDLLESINDDEKRARSRQEFKEVWDKWRAQRSQIIIDENMCRIPKSNP